MEEKKKKKFIIPLPYTGGNLGKTLMFGLVIILAVVGAMMLQAKELTQIQEDGYVVEAELSDALKNGVTDPVSQDEVELYAVSAWQKVYSRMGSLYVGEEQQKFQKTYPEFLESGSGVRFLDDEATLIGEDMTTRLPVYDGLRVNNGNTFGEDGIQADVENFILTALANGLYINTQNMELTYAENRKVVPVDSVVYFGDSEVRCYSRTEGILKYQEITGLMAAEITIGNLHMNYRDFLDLLRNPGSGSGVDEPSDEPAIYDDGAEEATASAGTIITTPGKAESLDSLKTESNTEEKKKDQNQQDSVKKDSQNSDNNGNASSQNGGNAGRQDNAGNASSGSGSGSSGKDAGNSSSSDSNNSSNSNNGTKDDKKGDSVKDNNAQPGNGEPGQDDTNTTEDPADIGDHVPTITAGDFSTEVYHIRTSVNVDDAYGQLYKITYKLYWGSSDLKTIRLRKSIRSTKLNEDGSMDVDLSLVPPGTIIRVEGTFTYYNNEGEKIEKDFLPEGGVTLKTYSIEEGLQKGLLERITVSYDNTKEILPRSTNGLSLSELTTGVPEIMKDYLYRTAVRVKPEGKKDYLDIAWTSSDLRKLKAGTPIAWSSEATVANTDFLSSNTVFHYQILLQDKFGNDLPLQTSAGVSGDLTSYLSGIVATAKRAPLVSITEERVSNPDAVTIGRKTLNIKLNNQNAAELLADQVNTSTGTVSRKIWLQIYTIDNGTEHPVAIDALSNPALTTLYDNTWIALDPEQMAKGNGQKLEISNLPAGKGIAYDFRVFANYNVTPDNKEDLQREEDAMRTEIGSYQSAAIAITRLGYGYYALSSTAQDTTAAVTAQMTNSTGTALRSLFSRFEIKLIEGNTSGAKGGSEKYTVQLRKKDFYEADGITPKKFPDDSTYVLASEIGKYTVSVKGTAGEEIWKTLCQNNPVLDIQYKNLNSTLYYQTQISTFVEQGYTGSGTKEHDVTGASNTTTFRMLRLKPTVSATNFYTVSDFIEIRGLQIYDKDGTISGTATESGTTGNVIVQLLSWNGSSWDVSQSRMVNATADKNARLENIRFKSLKRNQKYRMNFIAVSYNQTFSAINAQASYVLDVEQADWTVTTGTGITSSLALMGASEALAYVDEGSLDSMNLIDSELAETNYYLGDQGEKVYTGSTSWWTTDYIEVTPGDVLMMYRLNRTSNCPYISYYTEKSEDTAVKLWGNSCRSIIYADIYRSTYESQFGMMDYALIQVPDGVNYMRFSSISNNKYQSGPGATKLMSLTKMGLLDENNADRIFNGDELYSQSWSADTVKSGTMLNIQTKAEVSNGSYALSSPIPVQEEHYYVKTGGHPTNQSYVGFYDADGKAIEVLDKIYPYYKFQAPKGAVTMRIADYTDSIKLDSKNQPCAKLKVWEYNSEMVNSGKILMADESGDFYANVRSIVNDPSGDILGEDGKRSFIMRWYQAEGVDGATTSDKVLAEDTCTFDGTSDTRYHQKKLDGYCSYEVTLWVKLYGEEILLSELYFTTEEETYSIANDADLNKLDMFPYGKFVVVEDFETSRKNRAVVNFYGKIDGQGHTITRTSTISDLIYQLQDGAEIKNLHLDWKATLDKAIINSGGLVYENHGTLKNIIVDINLAGAFPLDDIGGAVRLNYGTIENFAVVYRNDLTAKTNWGGIAARNYSGGIIKNGYAYIPSNVRVNFASAQYLGNPENVVFYNGAILGLNYEGGLVQNVYMVGNVNVEKQNSNYYTSSAALGIGYNYGQAKNVLVRGDRYTYSINSTTNVQSTSQIFNSYGGSAIGVHGGSYSEDTVCYISPMEYVYSYKNHTKLDDSDLWNLTVMNELLNGDGQFQVEDDISAGYYPKVIMPDDMMEKQPSITLPGTVGSAAPEVLDAVVVDSGVDEQGNDYVIANIRFINSRKRQITEINIDGLDCEILGYPEDTNEYAVQVKLTNPQVFHSEYELKNFTYKISAIGDATRTVEYGADTQNGAKYLKVEFWRNISNLEEWNDAFADDKIDLTGNYRITSDIDFSGQPGGKVAQISKKYLGSGKYDGFTGNIRGAAGEDRTGTATLKNYPAEKGYVIEVMEKGSIENLIVDGLSFDEFTGVNTTMGLVGMASKSEFDHIEMKNVTMPGVSSSAGALAGSLTDCTVTWCSVTGAEITTTQPQGTAYELAVGGLLGSLTDTKVSSCYASDVAITALSGGGVKGIGGLIGSSAGNGSVNDTYASGSINSSFGSVGGLVGTTENPIRRAWTNVDIVSVANNIGGILGTAGKSINMTSTFAAGEVYSKTGAVDKVGRIYGSGIGSAKVTPSRCFAYEGQLVNGQLQKEKLDAYGLMTAERLSGSSAKIGWSRRIGIGSGFRFLGADSPEEINGLLPYLLDEDGTSLMAGQTPHLMKDQTLKMNPVVALKNVTGKTDETYPYQLNLSFVQGAGSDQYTVDAVTVEGMKVAEAQENKYLPETVVEESSADKTVTTRFFIYTGLESYQDNYRVTLKVKKSDGSSQTLSGVLQFSEENAPYLVIHNISEWKEYLGSGLGEKNLGQSYQNIKIDGTVDFSGMSNASLENYLNVKAAKVQATVGSTLKGLRYKASRAGEAVFADISGDLKGLAFEDMNLDVSDYGGSSIGLVGHLQGNGSELSFKEITIKGGAATEVGCIGTVEGTLTDIALHNINVTARGHYIGGLAGLARGAMTNVTLTGDLTYDEGSGTTTYGSNIINEGNYRGTGGLIGIASGAFENIKVSGTHVKGYERVGGVSGYENDNTNLQIEVGEETPKTADGTEVPFSVFVEGRTYVAGVAGQGSTSSSGTTVNFFKNVKVQKARISASSTAAAGIGGYTVRVEDSEISGCDIYAASAYASGSSGSWSNTYRTTVRDTKISSGSYVGGITAYASHMYDCTVTGSTITGSEYIGGALGWSYGTRVDSTGVTDSVIGADSARYVGGLIGGSYENSSTFVYAHAFNSFSKDSTITAASAAGGIIGYAKGGIFENNYSNATVIANEHAGGFAGLAEGYIMNSGTGRRLQIDGFYFRGTVKANLENAGALFGTYDHGAQPRNSDGTFYLDEIVPTKINADTVKTDDSIVDAGKVYIQRIILAPDEVIAGVPASAAKVANLKVSSNPDMSQSEIGTDAGTIPNLYLWDGFNKDKQSRLGSEDVTSEKLGDESFYQSIGFNSNYWNYMGLSGGSVSDAAIVPQEKGTLQLNVGTAADGGLADGSYTAEVSTGNYVQDDSMVLWLDALNNTGSGFDPDAAYWTNLATVGQMDENGDEKEPESYQLKNFAKGSWKSNGLYLTGYREYIDTIDNGELGHKIRTDENGKRYTGATISMMLKMDDDHHNIDNYVIYNRSSVLGGFELCFRRDGYTLLYADNTALNASNAGTLADGFYSSWPALYKSDSGKNIGGKYVQLTMVYKTYLGDTSADNTMDFTMYLDGQELYTVTGRKNVYESRYGNLFRVGGTGGYSAGNYGSIKGTIGSIMGYDRDLSADEVAQNARANQMRYNSAASLRGETVNGDIVGTGGTSVSTAITVADGKATLSLKDAELKQLLVSADPTNQPDAEVDGRQLNVRIKNGKTYLGGTVTYPLSNSAPTVESMAYSDAECTITAKDVNEAESTGTGWDYDNRPYIKVGAVTAASGGTATVSDRTYQWYSSTTGGYDGMKISGETSDTLQLSGSGYYYCRIKGTEQYTDSESGDLKERTVYGYTKVYRHKSVSYMPYLRSLQSGRNYATLPAQEGYYTNSAGEKVYYSSTDAVCSGGVPVPGDASTLSLMRAMWLMGSASEPAPAVQAYASGVNTLNVEFDSNIPFEDENYFGTTWFTIEADGQDVVLPEGTLTPMTFTDLDGKERTGYYIDTRVYSLTYDFQTELTITTWSEFFDAMTGDSYLDSQSCEVTPEQAARRVMTWGDAYAYINNKDMINGNIGRITHDGGFVNLYGGQALTADGQIVDMSDLKPVEKLKTKEAEASEDSESDSETAESDDAVVETEQSGNSKASESDDAKVESTGTATVVERDVNYEAAETALTVLPESVPLYTGEYEGYGIRTYAGFTQTMDGAGETYVSSRQLFVKNGQLFTMDVSATDGNVADGYILDTYQDYRYMTVLKAAEPHDLSDVEQPIHYPSDFANYNIAHISNTLDNSSDNHIVMGYYSHGTVWGFNYFTGEWLDLGSDANGGNFVTYLLGTIRAKFFNTLPVVNPEYQNALQLETNLGVYLLENADELPEGARSGYGDTVDDGSLLSLDTEKAIPIDHPGVTNANGDIAESGGDQEEGTALAQTDTSVASEDRALAEASEEDLQTPGGVLQKVNDDTQTDEADEAQTDAALDENSESGSSSMTKVGVDDAQQAVTGAGAVADADGTRAYGQGAEDVEAPEDLIDGDSTADGTAVTEDAADGRQLADASLTTVYNASTGNYGVYTTEDILTATDEKLQTVDTRLVMMGADLTPIYIDQTSTLTEKEQNGIRVLLVISGGVVVLLAGMMLVHTRKRKRR